MALWQWDIWLVPRQTVVERLSVVPSHMDLDWFESVEWWAGATARDIISFFNSILPVEDAPWAAKNTRTWGTDDGDEIMLVTDQGQIKDISIRIDLRRLDANFLNSLISFAKGKDFIFYTLESRRFVKPVLGDVLNEIRNSRKIRFLQDPAAFFEDKEYIEKVNRENRKKLKNRE
jgi:hypothetical protein